MLTIAPRAAASLSRACVQQRIVPVRLIATVSANTSGSCSSSRRITPAQLTSTSSRGRSPTSRADRRVVAHVERDARRAAGIRAASARRRPPRRVAPVAVTTAPSAANASAMPAPMPLVPPVDEHDASGVEVVAERARHSRRPSQQRVDVTRARQRIDRAVPGGRDARPRHSHSARRRTDRHPQRGVRRTRRRSNRPRPSRRRVATRCDATATRVRPSSTMQPSRAALVDDATGARATAGVDHRVGFAGPEHPFRILARRQAPVGGRRSSRARSARARSRGHSFGRRFGS